ncbi:MAG: TRAP transporter small permease [Betaproteobacteria bacterium]
MSLLARASRHADQAVEVATSTVLAVVVLINGLELVARNFFNYSFVWAHEVNLLLASWVYFLGMSMVYARNADITVEYFTAVLPPGVQRIWIAACNVAVIGVLAVIAWYCWVLMRLQADFRTTGLGIPNPFFSAPVFMSALVMGLHVWVQTLDILKGKA